MQVIDWDLEASCLFDHTASKAPHTMLKLDVANARAASHRDGTISAVLPLLSFPSNSSPRVVAVLVAILRVLSWASNLRRSYWAIMLASPQFLLSTNET